MPALIVLKGPDEGKRFELAGPVAAVGRHTGSTIPLRDPQVSRRHLELTPTPAGRWVLADLGSGNGTWVNGRPVETVELHAGDTVTVGQTTLLFAADPTPAPADRSDTVTLTPGPAADLSPSAVLRSVAEDAGRRALGDAGRSGTDWLRTRLASLTVLYEATSAVSQILDVDELLGRIVDLVLKTTDADRGCVLLRDEESGELMPKAVRSGTGTGGGEFAVSRTIVEHVLRERRGVLVADAAADERFRGGESIVRHGIREVICVPMRGRHETVGVLVLDTRGPAGRAAGGATKFTDDHLTLAVAVAHQAALAVEETRYYRALMHAERLAAVGQTIAALSHHIKNIMHGVRFGADMVRLGLAENDADVLRKGWKLVERNQGRIDELILDMLSYSKDREPAAEPTDLNRLVGDVLDVVRGRAAERGVDLVWQPVPDLPPVSCDPEGIHRALLNVVTNAVDAVEDSGSPRVEVTVTLAAGAAEIAVADNGPGVPADKREDIFKPFVSTKGSRGTGLGLPVSRKTLREHGGDLTVSGDPGRGSRFALRIPVAKPDGDPTAGGPPSRQ